ncbi:MAG: hypothetical protein IJQ89_02405 [Bacteroidales bacterium]|nr:hypothetical protein [Bacteroidales bacterium]
MVMINTRCRQNKNLPACLNYSKMLVINIVVVFVIYACTNNEISSINCGNETRYTIDSFLPYYENDSFFNEECAKELAKTVENIAISQIGVKYYNFVMKNGKSYLTITFRADGEILGCKLHSKNISVQEKLLVENIIIKQHDLKFRCEYLDDLDKDLCSKILEWIIVLPVTADL